VLQRIMLALTAAIFKNFELVDQNSCPLTKLDSARQHSQSRIHGLARGGDRTLRHTHIVPTGSDSFRARINVVTYIF